MRFSFWTFFRFFFFSPSAGAAAFAAFLAAFAPSVNFSLGSGGGQGFACSGCTPADEDSANTLSATQERVYQAE